MSAESGQISTPLWDYNGKKMDDITFCAPEALQILLQQQGVGNFDTLIDTVLTSLAKTRCDCCKDTTVRYAFPGSGAVDGKIQQIFMNRSLKDCVKILWNDGDTKYYGFKQTLTFAITSCGSGDSCVTELRLAERAVNV